jgi:hypothetical protein
MNLKEERERQRQPQNGRKEMERPSSSFVDGYLV